MKRISALWMGLLAAAPFAAAQIPTGVTFRPVFLSDGMHKFTWPTALEEIPGAENRFLVLEKNYGGLADSARIWLLAPGSGLEYTKRLFLTLPVHSENVGNAELGLLGLAFHPRFRENRKYYVDYNPTSRIHAVEERTFTADFAADAGTAKRIIEIPANSGHNGGGLVFGPDGLLYIGAGDAVNPANGQSRASLNGKILRIDVDGPSGGLAYGIPGDNPFQASGQRGEIYAFGFRNPYRLSFDALTGHLWVGDVGLATWEEINRVEKGGNYGWAAFEGSAGGGGPCSTAACLPPATQYGRGQGRSVIGGHVYRGDPLSPFYGVYIFGDYEYNGPVYGFHVDGASGSHVRIGELGQAIGGMACDSRNNLYAIGHGNGIIYRLEHAGLRAVAASALPGRTRPARLRVDLERGHLFWSVPGGPGRQIRMDGRLSRGILP